jgi:Fe-S-cluster containining protein
MRSSDTAAYRGGDRADDQAEQRTAGMPAGADLSVTSDRSMVVLTSESLRAAEDYCQTLPLHLCHGCDGCGMRCAEGIRITRSEYLRIEQHLKAHPGETARVQAQDKSIPGWPVNKFCQFRDTELDRCSIYPVRPVICRLFGHTEWLPCPLGIVPLLGQEAMDVYQRYAGEELRTIDQWRQLRPGIEERLPADEELGAD